MIRAIRMYAMISTENRAVVVIKILMTMPIAPMRARARGWHSQNPEHQPHFGRTASEYLGSHIFSYFGRMKQSAAVQLSPRMIGQLCKIGT